MACSSSSSSTNDPNAPASDAGPEGAATTDADTADTAEPADAAPPDRIGAIFAISDTTATDGGTKSAYRAGGSFRHTTSPDTTTKTKTVGPCMVETIGDGEPAKEEILSAGALHIAGGAKAIDISPDSKKQYAVSSGNTALWNGGEMLTASADGKDVPAFTTSLVAPSKITLSAPAAPGGSLTVARSAGVNATFTGTSSGVVVLYFDIAAGQAAYAATCTFDAKSGSGQIPAAAFADFPAGEGTFDFYVKETSVTTPPGWQVRFTASKALVDSAGEALAGRATFE